VQGEVVAAAAAAAVVVGRMAAAVVAVGAQAGRSLAGTVDSHWPRWMQTPISQELISTKDIIKKRCEEKTEEISRVAPRGQVFPGIVIVFFNGE
jgi:hypothetical protein